jgi:hypothetical protein
MQEENTTSAPGAAVVPNVELYLADIASTAREAAETQNPKVRRACIELLARQTGRLTALGGLPRRSCAA